MTTLNDEQIRSVITDALGGMDRYTFDEVIYIARTIEDAVQDAATVEIERLKEVIYSLQAKAATMRHDAVKREALIERLKANRYNDVGQVEQARGCADPDCGRRAIR